MSVFHFIITVFLFVLLTPGILLRLPPKGSKWIVAIVHGIVFALSMHIVYYYILPSLRSLEGFKEGSDGNKKQKKDKKNKKNVDTSEDTSEDTGLYTNEDTGLDTVESSMKQK
jgi:hypothetical protein